MFLSQPCCKAILGCIYVSGCMDGFNRKSGNMATLGRTRRSLQYLQINHIYSIQGQDMIPLPTHPPPINGQCSRHYLPAMYRDLWCLLPSKAIGDEVIITAQLPSSEIKVVWDFDDRCNTSYLTRIFDVAYSFIPHRNRLFVLLCMDVSSHSFKDPLFVCPLPPHFCQQSPGI